MDTINHDELTDLLEQHESIHISLFMPLEWEPNNLSANSIRLKNLIKQGHQQLTAEGFLPSEISQAEIENIFQPAQELLGNGRLEVKRGQGLAIFLAPEFSRILSLALPLEEQVVIGPRFHLIPLLPLFNNRDRFYLLTLSQKQVQLWQGDAINLEKVEVPDLPKGMEEALALEDPERSLQFHTNTEPRQSRPAAFYGHDADKEKKGAILRYCREVDKVLQSELRGKEIPLLLASVAYLQPIYEEANSYSHLSSEGVSGNPDNLSDHELHEQAWQVRQHQFEKANHNAWQRYLDLAGTGKTSQSLSEIVPAAVYGRVDTLFVPLEPMKKGRFDPSSAEVELCQADDFDCEDLMNLTAVTTLKNGGAVYTVMPEEIPGDDKLAAIFRYSG